MPQAMTTIWAFFPLSNTTPPQIISTATIAAPIPRTMPNAPIDPAALLTAFALSLAWLQSATLKLGWLGSQAIETPELTRPVALLDAPLNSDPMRIPNKAWMMAPAPKMNARIAAAVANPGRTAPAGR